MEVFALDGVPEVVPGSDLAALIAEAAADADQAPSVDSALQSGDVVVVTSKVVAKAAGLAVQCDREVLIDEQTDRVVARRGPTRIVRTHHGLTMAAAGVDNSNLAEGWALPLPPAPDADAAAIRRGLRELTGLRIAIIISDTAGRAWRDGQTDIAIGCAGIAPSESFAGRSDGYGNPLAVTAPALVDELAGTAEIASGKLGNRPFTVIRGVNPDWLLADDGPGAAALIRAEAGDMFGLGSRDAVVAALLRNSQRGFPEPVPGGEWEWSVIDRLLVEATDTHPEVNYRVRLEPAPTGQTPELAAEQAGPTERLATPARRVEIATAADPVAAGALAERLRTAAFALRLDLDVTLV